MDAQSVDSQHQKHKNYTLSQFALTGIFNISLQLPSFAASGLNSYLKVNNQYICQLKCLTSMAITP
jgi:hypothetical protein